MEAPCVLGKQGPSGAVAEGATPHEPAGVPWKMIQLSEGQGGAETARSCGQGAGKWGLDSKVHGQVPR